MVILNSLPHLLPWPFLIFTGQGLILYANHSFKNLFVHPPSEGDSLEKIFFKFSPSSIKTWTGKVRIKNGLLKNTKKFLEVIITPDNQDPKQFWLFIKTSSSRARTDRLSLALEKAQQQLEQKSILTANICHEIRNSVSIILGLCEENLEGNLDYKNSPFQKIIYHSAELKNLIQDVLDFSSHEIGGVILEKDSFDPVQVFEDSVILNYPSTQRKNIELVALACPQSPRLVIGDAIKFRRIINNLVGNAIKFTEKGFVHCYLNFKNQGSFCLATLTIDDSGIGISSQHQRKIFAPFTQADDSTAQRFGGHGLGLSIVKELTTAMGGGVKVISKINQGSRFIVTIKWEVNPQMELPQRLDLSDLKILLVGGQSEIQNRLINYFAYCGTQINLAKNNVEAEEMWHTSVSRAQPYTHVLIDLPMDTAPSLPLLPIHKIVLIADRDLHLRDIQHIPKPLTLSALNHFFGRPFNQTVSYNQANKKISSKRLLKILLAEDNEVNREVTARRLKKAGHEVTATVDGQAALELWRSKDFDLAIIDLQMPLLDGISLVKCIREEESRSQRKSTKLVALTAMDYLAKNKNYLKEVGLDDYFLKPIRGSDLVEKINRLFAVKNASLTTDEFHEALSGAEEDESEDLKCAARVFLRHSQSIIIQFEEVMQNADPESIAQECHSLKGMLALMACPSLANLAGELEQNPSGPNQKDNAKKLSDGLHRLEQSLRYSPVLATHGQDQNQDPRKN